MYALLIASIFSCFGYQSEQPVCEKKPALPYHEKKGFKKVTVHRTSKSIRKKIAHHDDISAAKMRNHNDTFISTYCRFQEIRADCLAALAHPSFITGFKEAISLWTQESNTAFDSQAEHPSNYMRLQLAQLLKNEVIG
jgi:hypothetical protein